MRFSFILVLYILNTKRVADCLSIPSTNQNQTEPIVRNLSSQSLGFEQTGSNLSQLAPSVESSRPPGRQNLTHTFSYSLYDQSTSSNSHQDQQASKQRSSNIEYGYEQDDLIPLATINNHSPNSGGSSSAAGHQQSSILKPPQYVDVSALVGRDRISNTSTNQFNTSSPSGTMTNLSPKIRSTLPECATQQVCNAIFVRMNYTQRLCECSSNYNWKCSNNYDPQDGHTIELTRKFDKRIYTQIKTCEPLREVRACKSPSDWTLLALQSERTGKAHYIVVCKCPTWAQLEGPYTHNHPPYANIPGVRVYGMLCAHQTARSSSAQTYSAYNPALNIYPEFPWTDALNVLNTTNLIATLDTAS